MVNPMWILATALGAAFLLGLLPDRQRRLGYALTLGALGFMTWVALDWTTALWLGQRVAVDLDTAGVPAPFSIQLRLGMPEAVLLLTLMLSSVASAVLMQRPLMQQGQRALSVYLVLVMACAGLVMTRDIFNLFVFFELMVLATAGLMLLSDAPEALGAGFKYLLVSQVVSILLLLGIIFTYHATGSLNLDDLVPEPLIWGGSGLGMAFVIMALVIELKPYPANGWALDLYTTAHPGVGALLSAASASAALYAIDKVLAMAPQWSDIVSGLGLLSALGSHLLARVQTHDRRLLGYSSVGQLGLLLFIAGQRALLGDDYLWIAGGILLSHALAKVALFWMSSLVTERALSAWAALRPQPLMVLGFIVCLAMLIGLPPFPGFYAKWDLVHALVQHDRMGSLALLLLATLLEASYLFQWFGQLMKRPLVDEQALPLDRGVSALVGLVVLTSLGLSWVWGQGSAHGNMLSHLPLLAALAFWLLEPLPARAKNLLAIGGLLAWLWWRAPGYDPLQMVFGLIFLLGGAVIMLAGFQVSGRRLGFYPSAMLMYAGLAQLVEAQTSFDFLVAWELMTLGSYLLILRGRDSEPHALSYGLFSLAGAFCLLTGFAMAAQGQAEWPLSGLSAASALPVAPWVFVLLSLGFLSKTAVLGLHIWLPGAHAEAETDVSPVVSGIVLKAGLLGLWTLLMGMGHVSLWGIDLTHALAWWGAATALVGGLMAVFQEDAKRLLAYSSISQLGYAVFGLALMNHLGWLVALMFVINHFVYKAMLFLAAGGVAKRTGTRLMYRMGGLIKRMPLSFVSVLVGIIAMSGVPPLSGFGGRWIFYNAILDGELRLPVVLIFMSGPVAFLYLFRLIHTIFLGQLKDEHRQLREAPFWIVLPQMVLLTFLLAFAVWPGLVLRRVDAYLASFFGNQALSWNQGTIASAFGYWNPVAIMTVTATVFGVIFLLLLAFNHRAQQVGQFNIVFSAERPYRPDTTHFAWNFFAPYRKAIGVLVQPLATRFWQHVADALWACADLLRRAYTGNGQTYALHVLAYAAMVCLLLWGSAS